MSSNWRLGLGYSLITAIMWGLLPLALKGLLGQMDPMTITWYRFIVSAVLALAWYGHRSGPAVSRLFSRSHRLLTFIAAAGLLANYALYLLGLDHITASGAQITIQLAPLLLLLGSIVIFKEAFSVKQWLGVAAFVMGLLLFFHHRLGAMTPTDSSYLQGLLLIVAASVLWAAYALAQKQLLKAERSSDILLIMYVAGALFFLPFAQPSQIMALNVTELVLLAFAALNTIIAYGAFGLAMTHWEASRVSAAITVAPLLTLAFVEVVVLWYPDYMETEPLDLLSWLGGILVVIGSIVAALAKSTPKHA